MVSRIQMQVWHSWGSQIKRLSSVEQHSLVIHGPRLEQESTGRDVPEFDGSVKQIFDHRGVLDGAAHQAQHMLAPCASRPRAATMWWPAI